MNDRDDERYYQDEPINIKSYEEKVTFIMPPLIRKARLLERTIKFDSRYSEKLFYLEGKLLEDYEDDFVYDKEVLCYYPTYQKLSLDELRGYFTWRTKIRNDIYEYASTSYAFLYIYELINQIGVKKPIDGYNKLKALQLNYEPLDKSVSYLLNKWIFDYIIYYGLDKSLLADSKECLYDHDLLILLNMNDYKTEDVITSMNNLSTYKFIKSPFYKKNQVLYETLLLQIFKSVSVYYANHHRNTLINDYFHFSKDRITSLFYNCVFYGTEYKGAFVVTIDELRSYDYQYYHWNVTGFSTHFYPCKQFGYLLKTIESVLRKGFNYGHDLKKEINFKWLEKIINEEIENFKKNQKQAKKIEIDYSKLCDIRKDAETTRDKLIVDEEMETDNEEINVDNITNETSLSDSEYELLKCLLYGKDYSYLIKKGLILSVLVDNINEKMYDVFNDNILVFDDQIEIIEDYIEDLKGEIK